MAQRPAGCHGGRPLSAILAGLLLLPLLQAGRSCSTPCFCFATPDTLQCRLGRLLEPPAELPPAARNLSIAGGNLTVLRAAAFAGGWLEGREGKAAARPLAHLTLLVLTHDAIEALEEAAFAGLPALAALDLSHNRLRAVAPGAFAGCAQLRTLRLNQALRRGTRGGLGELLDGALANLSLARLELAGNRLRELPPGTALPPGLRLLDARNNSLQALAAEQLDGLAALGRPRLLLAANPLRCDCASLRPLLVWLRNASADDDRGLLHCASPRPLKGWPLGRLRASQLGCGGGEGAELGLPADDASLRPPETASYVFFGIVLALIGVVFLMVLYLNRRGIKRWLNNLRDACRDQMEGYHYRYEQDCDPRRAGTGGL
ncbi:LOW QUALITY PROTEIN: trophoblast glycoprotein-like [Heteronotia binoei]|uniref:LOW QUALITY PROTEIN: trophoblast glycoprotein-like n=1 Tax=Heteronotia binoei TaxID=13085 RepID=UPI00292F4AD1|nr:LOW QUALITY PROTEIN: trophoblast glycoprotein-like [Heteronotia binoei]